MLGTLHLVSMTLYGWCAIDIEQKIELVILNTIFSAMHILHFFSCFDKINFKATGVV